VRVSGLLHSVVILSPVDKVDVLTAWETLRTSELVGGVVGENNFVPAENLTMISPTKSSCLVQVINTKEGSNKRKVD
jgi:hypothetical protein